ncbi:hypothetical protein SAMN05192532_103111 [Alteribacillus iranensis]|uniref:Uncharacterized protein n=1 Tax=Alteribacillus iranensis TaxID=930128 RepID=A0A1I2CQ70_9BACI|nr:hypothetical protein SAMN05192532_103111 [Alteribacillus iranensis]
MSYYPPYPGPPRPPYKPPKKPPKRPFRRRPYWWRKLKLICFQILLPLVGFQLIRTIILPTTFDVVLLIILCCLFFYCVSTTPF